MAFSITLLLLSSVTAVVFTFPRSTFDNVVRAPGVDFDSSGAGPVHEPVQGIVKVVQLDPHALLRSGLLGRGLSPRRVPSLGSKLAFPAFLSRGRPAPASSRTLASPLQHLLPKSPTEAELKKREGLLMWQRATDKGEKTSLPVQLKDMKQSCAAVPFTQLVTAEGCDAVRVHNRLCFGQCSSLFVPSEGDPDRLRAPCSRCAPSKAHTLTVPLRCGAGGARVLHRRVMVVDECRCETGREQKSAEAASSTHL